MTTDSTAKPLEVHDVVDFKTYDGETVEATVRKVRPAAGDAPPRVDLAAHIRGRFASFHDVPFDPSLAERYRWAFRPAKPVFGSEVSAGDVVDFHHEGLVHEAKVLRAHPTEEPARPLLDLGVWIAGRSLTFARVRPSGQANGYCWSRAGTPSPDIA